jgi:hypothetical protein
MTTKSTKPLTEDERAAVNEAIASGGRGWKSLLRGAWTTGNYMLISGDHKILLTLRNMRKSHGNEWLVNYRPERVQIVLAWLREKTYLALTAEQHGGPLENMRTEVKALVQVGTWTALDLRKAREWAASLGMESGVSGAFMFPMSMSESDARRAAIRALVGAWS